MNFRPKSALRGVLAITLAAGLSSCGTGSAGSGPTTGGASSSHGAGGMSGQGGAGTTGAGGKGAGGAGGNAGCLLGGAVDMLRACLDAGNGPDTCVAQIATPLCDTDSDGLGDDLEAALALAYGPVFAFNGGAYGGDPETHWPINAKHFVTRSKVVYRPDGQPDALVDPQPSLASVGQETYSGANAADPAAGEGADFWLCLTDMSPATLVTSSDLMVSLPDGIDVEVIAHPANGALDASSHLFVSFGLLFAYNQHTGVDNHEGDRESVEVFVDRKTGAVDAVWFDRHSTRDNTWFIDAASYSTFVPGMEVPYGNIDSSDPKIHGLRFWDHATEKHHVVAYVGTGGHAMYDYPANTYIVPFGPRDTHDGDGLKLLSFSGELVPDFSAGSGQKVAVHVTNPGEASSLVLPWARFRGQWGCTNDLIAKSWPGPFGNARHPRPVLERTWGSPPAP